MKKKNIFKKYFDYEKINLAAAKINCKAFQLCKIFS
jgi:hypothetical protein